MKNIPIVAKPDHLCSITRAKSPISAIAELVWNALDAEADVIEIETVENKLGGLEKVIVKDNGFGLPYEFAFESFGSLGGSWKRDKRTTDISHRKIHGRNGKGRFQAFSIGNVCDWIFTYSEDQEQFAYTVSGEYTHLAAFSISDEKRPVTGPIGTVVTISDIGKDYPSLQRKHAALKLAELFALFLTQYPDIKIVYDGERISPDKVKISTTSLALENEAIDDERSFSAEIEIVRWTMAQERSLVLCNRDGFALRDLKARIHSPGCKNWTAYIKSDIFAELDEEHRLEFDELDSFLEKIISLLKNRVKQHFQEREAVATEDLVEVWKKEAVYPYKDGDDCSLSGSQIKTFDVCAFSISDYLADFENSSSDNKTLIFRMLRELLEENPSTLKTILNEVLHLPKEKQIELEKLLKEPVLSY